MSLEGEQQQNSAPVEKTEADMTSELEAKLADVLAAEESDEDQPEPQKMASSSRPKTRKETATSRPRTPKRNSPTMRVKPTNRKTRNPPHGSGSIPATRSRSTN